MELGVNAEHERVPGTQVPERGTRFAGPTPIEERRRRALARCATIQTMSPERSGSDAPQPAAAVARAVDDLVDEVRSEALWFLRPDFYPRTDLERLRVLDDIQKHANAEAFRRAGKLKEWLSPRAAFVEARVTDGADAVVVE